MFYCSRNFLVVLRKAEQFLSSVGYRFSIRENTAYYFALFHSHLLCVPYVNLLHAVVLMRAQFLLSISFFVFFYGRPM